MFAAPILVVSLIAASSQILFMDAVLIHGFALAIMGAAILALAVSIRGGELRCLAQLVNSVLIIVVVPAIWMLFQVLPLPRNWLAHPIWTSAAAGLGIPMHGVISIDVGATLLSFARYCGVLGMVLVAAAVALDRQRAKSILFVLTGITAVIAAALLSYDLGYGYFGGFQQPEKRVEALSIAVLGLILSSSAIIRTYGSNEAPPPTSGNAPHIRVFALIPSAAALVICLLPIILNSDRILYFGAIIGVGTVIIVPIIRRLRLRRWGQSAIAAIAIFGATLFIATEPGINEADPILALSSQSRDSMAATVHMLSDAPWTGTGAGTFQALLTIYRGPNDAGLSGAPTAAASIAVELGKPMLWGLFFFALAAALTFIKRALERGRDSCYAAAGAGSVLAMVIFSFGNAGILGSAAPVLAAATLGLALGQSRSVTTMLSASANDY